MIAFPRRHWLRGLPLLLLAVIIVSPAAPAQDFGSAMDEQQAMMLRQARQQSLDRLRTGGPIALEGAIDADEYLVGPGDEFVVSIGGAMATQVTTVVTADGRLVVPDAGTFVVAGLSLAEAQDRIRVGLRRVYRNVASDVALAQPRQFYVHVSGAVERPGRHIVAPIARVEDAVAAGMDGQSPLFVFRASERPPGSASARPALRNIEVRRRDGSSQTVDLLRYYATGETAHNPYLVDGDALYVPTLEAGGARMVFVEREALNSTDRQRGNVLSVDHRPDDSVLTLLLVAGGRELVESTDFIRLTRRESDGGITSRSVDVGAIRSGASPDPAIMPDDRILIPRTNRGRGSASIVGLVQFPGTYPVVDGVTTLSDLIEAAGGLRPDALLRAAYLERVDGASGVGDRAPDFDDPRQQVPQQARRAMEMEEAAFESARLSDLPFASRQYLGRELTGFRRVSLDLGDNPSTIPETPLQDGDRFVVPRDPGAVLVVGQVRQPGYVPLREGADAAYYVEQTGGTGPAASSIFVREAESGYFRRADAGALRSGDVVFVDRDLVADTESLQALTLQEQQLAFQRDQQRQTARLQIFQASLAVVSTAVAIVTTYLLATR
jgi:polysaccharide biosynthesis/export protein